jgi:hypothetical protein
MTFSPPITALTVTVCDVHDGLMPTKYILLKNNLLSRLNIPTNYRKMALIPNETQNEVSIQTKALSAKSKFNSCYNFLKSFSR